MIKIKLLKVLPKRISELSEREKILLYGKYFKQLDQDLDSVAKNANRSFSLSPCVVFDLYNRINRCLILKKVILRIFANIER